MSTDGGTEQQQSEQLVRSVVLPRGCSLRKLPAPVPPGYRHRNFPTPRHRRLRKAHAHTMMLGVQPGQMTSTRALRVSAAEIGVNNPGANCVRNCLIERDLQSCESQGSFPSINACREGAHFGPGGCFRQCGGMPGPPPLSCLKPLWQVLP